MNQPSFNATGAPSDMPENAAAAQQQAPAAPQTAKRLDPGLKRNLLIIGAVVGLSFLGVGGTTEPASPVIQQLLRELQQADDDAALAGAPTAELTMKQLLSELQQADDDAALAGASTTEPTMKQLLSELQQADADAARRAGRPYIPPDSAALADQSR
jgi:hypothetical protein